MAKARFELRKPYKPKKDIKDKKEKRILNDEVTQIRLVMRWDVTSKIVYPTGLNILPKYWDMEKERAITKKEFPTHPEFNARLGFIHQLAESKFLNYVNTHNRQPTIKAFREVLHLAFNKKSIIKHDLLTFAQTIADACTIRKHKPVSEGTKKAYEQTILHLTEFKEAKNKRVGFDNIDEDFYNEFRDYLTEEKKFSPNTIGKHIKQLKVFINEAKEVYPDLKISTKKFAGMTEETDSIYLNHDELKELYELDLSNNPRLDRVRDLFILGAYTGLRFSDYSAISKENIVGDRFLIKTKKTKKPVSIPFHFMVEAIIKKYNGEFPAISNVKMNEYLKELGKLTELLKVKETVSKTRGGVTATQKVAKHDLLTTHSARRSMATNAYKDGVPTLTIMAITGHSTEKSFLRYIKVTPDEHATILDNHWKKQASNNLKIA